MCTSLTYSSSDLCYSMQRLFHLDIRHTDSLRVLFKKSGKWLQMQVFPQTQHDSSVSHVPLSNSCSSKVSVLAGCQHWLYFNTFCTQPDSSLTAHCRTSRGHTGTDWILNELFFNRVCVSLFFLKGVICDVSQGGKQHSNKRRRIPQTLIFVVLLSTGDLPISFD